MAIQSAHIKPPVTTLSLETIKNYHVAYLESRAQVEDLIALTNRSELKLILARHHTWKE
jgi:hypothetical protein